jgi:hypothetical protein
MEIMITNTIENEGNHKDNSNTGEVERRREDKKMERKKLI